MCSIRRFRAAPLVQIQQACSFLCWGQKAASSSSGSASFSTFQLQVRDRWTNLSAGLPQLCLPSSPNPSHSFKRIMIQARLARIFHSMVRKRVVSLYRVPPAYRFLNGVKTGRKTQPKETLVKSNISLLFVAMSLTSVESWSQYYSSFRRPTFSLSVNTSLGNG